jgi:hypothetical protein
MGKKKGQGKGKGKDKDGVVVTEPPEFGFPAGAKGKRHGAGRKAMLAPHRMPDEDTSSTETVSDPARTSSDDSHTPTPPRRSATAGASNPTYTGDRPVEDDEAGQYGNFERDADGKVTMSGAAVDAGYIHTDGVGHGSDVGSQKSFMTDNSAYGDGDAAAGPPLEHEYDNSGDEAGVTAGDDVYNMGTASAVVQTVGGVPRGGIAFGFFNLGGWRDAGATFRLQGLASNPYRVWSNRGEASEVGQLVPQANDEVVLTPTQLEGLSLHQVADDQPWEEGRLVFSLYEKGAAEPKEAFQVFINPAQIAKQEEALEAKREQLRVMKVAANTAGVDGYLESHAAPPPEFDGFELKKEAAAQETNYDLGGTAGETRAVVLEAKNVHLVIQGQQIAYQIMLPEAPKNMLTISAAEQRRRDRELKERGAKEERERQERLKAETKIKATVFNGRVESALDGIIDNALFVTLGNILRTFGTSVSTDQLYKAAQEAKLKKSIEVTAQQFVAELYKHKEYRGLKAYVNEMLDAGCESPYVKILEKLAESESKDYQESLKRLKEDFPGFFTEKVEIASVKVPEEAAKLEPYLAKMAGEIGRQESDYGQDDAILLKRFKAIENRLATFKKKLAISLNDPATMPEDFEQNLAAYMKGKKKVAALDTLFEAELASLGLSILGGRPQGGDYQRGIKDVIDARIKAKDRNIRTALLAFGGQSHQKAKACLGVLPRNFFEKLMVTLTQEDGGDADAEFGFAGQSYEAAPSIAPEAIINPTLRKYLWNIVAQVVQQEKLKSAAVVIAEDLLAAGSNNAMDAAVTLQRGAAGDAPMIMVNKAFALPVGEARKPEEVAKQLGVLKVAVNELIKLKVGKGAIQTLLEENDAKNVVSGLLRDKNSTVNSKTFYDTLFDGGANADNLIEIYELYYKARDEEIQAAAGEKSAAARAAQLKAEKDHERTVRKAKVCGVVTCMLLAVGGVLTWQFMPEGDDAAPGAQSAPSVGYDFDTACAQSTQFTPAELAQVAHALGFGTLMIGGVIGQHLLANLTGVTNAAFEAILDAAPHVAFRVKAGADVSIEAGTESVQDFVVATTEGADQRTNYSILSGIISNVTERAYLAIERLTVVNISDTSSADCYAGNVPLQIDPLSNFASASTNTNSFLALSNNQPRPLGFDYQLNNPLPAGLTLQARVTGITNGILQRADGSFVTGGSNGAFPVALGDVSGLQFLATQGYQGLVTPTLELQVFDPNANNGAGAVIDLADAHVTQSLNIDYVLPLNAPTLSVTMPAVNEGASATLDVDVFLDPGVTGVTVEKIIRDIPVGTRLVSGNNTYVATDPVATNNVVDVTSWGSGDIAVSRVNPNDNGLYPLTVVARSTRVATGETTQSQQIIQAQFNAVSDVMNIHTNSTVALTEGVDLVMPLRLSPTGGASDSLTGLNLNGLPTGAVVTNAPHGSSLITQTVTVPANGEANIFSWTNDWTQQREIYVHFPPFYHGGVSNQINIGVQATTQDGSSTPAVNNGALAVNFTPVSNAISISQAPDVARFQGNETIACGWSIDASTVDPSEVHVVEVHRILNGSSLINMQTNATIPVSAQGVGTVQLTQVPHLGISPEGSFAGTLTPELRISSQFGSLPPALTSDTFTITLQSAVPVIQVSDALTTNEDVPVSFSITTTFADNVLFSNIPAGTLVRDSSQLNRVFTSTASLSSVNVTEWDLSQLSLTPPLHSGDDVDFLVTATRTHNGQVLSAQHTVQIDVVPVADPPILTVSNSSLVVDEGTPSVPLGINASLVDPSGEVLLDLSVEGVLHGQLSAGVNNGAGNWTVPPGDINGLSFSPDSHYGSSSPINLMITASARELANGHTASRAQQVSILVNPVATLPVVNIGSATGTEDQNIQIGPPVITINPVDTDGSELYEVRFGPMSGTLTVGSRINGTTTWRVTQSEFGSSLNYRAPQNYAGQVLIPIQVITYDGDDTASLIGLLTVNVNSVADVPVFQLPSVITFSQASPVVNLGQDLNISLTDQDGSESLSVQVANVAFGTLNPAGVFQGGLRYLFTESQFSALTYTPDISWFASHPQGHTLNIKAIVTDGPQTLEIPGPGQAQGVIVRLAPGRHVRSIQNSQVVTKTEIDSMLSQASWTSLWQQSANEPAVNKGNVAQNNEAPRLPAVHG